MINPAKNNFTQPLRIKEYKAVTYVRIYFSKTEDQCSQSLKKAAKENLDNNIHHYDTIKTNAKAFLSNRIFSAVYFVNTNLPEERVQLLLSKKELIELRDDSPNIFKRSNVGR